MSSSRVVQPAGKTLYTHLLIQANQTGSPLSLGFGLAKYYMHLTYDLSSSVRNLISAPMPQSAGNA